MVRCAWCALVIVALGLPALAWATPPPDVALSLPVAESPTTAPHPPCQIDQLEITGLWRTDPAIVRRELPWQPGQVVSADQWALGLARLWNMGLFSRVQAHLQLQDGQVCALLNLEERWTINPLFSFAVQAKRGSVGQSSSFWSVGGSDLNVAGQFVEAAAAFEQFDAFSGGLAFLRAHRFLGDRADAMLLWERLVRTRVGFADRRMRLRSEYNRLLTSDRLRVGGRLDWQWDDMFDAEGLHQPLPPSSRSLVLDLGVRFGRVDVQRVRQVGASVELRPAIGVTWVNGGPQTHVQIWGQALWFQAVGEHLNVAARAQFGWQTEVVPALQFFLGGLYEVRGVRDSFLRADRFALVNLEARMIAFDAMWLAIVPAVFADVAVARDRLQGPALVASAGGGVRLLVPRFVRTGLRIDMAVPMAGVACSGNQNNRFCPGLSLGVFQFF